MLTERQYEALRFVNDHIERTGISPSLEDVAEGLGLASKSGAHRILSQLVERGFIRRVPRRSHGIEVARMPGSTADDPDLLDAMNKIIAAYDSGKLPSPQIMREARLAAENATRRQEENNTK